MKHREPKEDRSRGRQQPADKGRTGNAGSSDYWDRIANDVAEGYGAQRSRGRSVLNHDQRPDDARRGDA